MIEHVGELVRRSIALKPFELVKTVVNSPTRKIKGTWTVEINQPIKAYIDPSARRALKKLKKLMND